MRATRFGDLDINSPLARPRSQSAGGPNEVAVVAARRQAARRALAGFALDRPDPVEFLADTIAALGLHPDNDPGQERTGAVTPMRTPRRTAVIAGYIIAGPEHGRIVANWDGEVHVERSAAEEALAECHAAGYGDWSLYALTPALGAASDGD